jgi:hypothetical protein
MNPERYLKALAEEVDRTVEEYRKESLAQVQTDRMATTEKPEHRFDVVEDTFSIYRRQQQQSNLFPGADSKMTRFDREDVE